MGNALVPIKGVVPRLSGNWKLAGNGLRGERPRAAASAWVDSDQVYTPRSHPPLIAGTIETSASAEIAVASPPV
jgi:hypothetical protein